MLTIDEQIERIRRGTEQIEPFPELKRKLERSAATGKPLRVKYGIDPTGIDVHLGHTVPLRKLRLFQELGHQAVLIIGNYTALVGDPSGKDETRARLTQEQVEKNAVDYLKQVSKVIDIDKAEVHRNGCWFGKYTFLDTLALTSKITIQRMLERDDFTKRFRAEPSVPIYLHECLYPLMQGQDSVEIKADIELGGSEQLFNLMMGRRLQEAAGQEPQICMTMPILRGLDGIRRMGKSLGNYVGIGEDANTQFAKTMSAPDELLKEWFELLTDRLAAEIAAILAGSPFDAKKTLGRDIVTFYHGPEAANAAQAEWQSRFSDKQDPKDIQEVSIPEMEIRDGKMPVIALLAKCFGMSNSELRRKVTEGAVNTGPDREKVMDPKGSVAIFDGLVVRLGSRNVRKVRIDRSI